MKLHPRHTLPHIRTHVCARIHPHSHLHPHPPPAFCEDGFYLTEAGCTACPAGTACATVPEQNVVLTTSTTLSLEGGVDALDTEAEKAKFAEAIVEAMAAGPNGLTVTVEVTRVAAVLSRRLEEPAEDAYSAAYASMMDALSKLRALNVEDEALKLYEKPVNTLIDFDSFVNLVGNDHRGLEPSAERRSLAASQVQIDFTITVPVRDNEAVGDLNAIKASWRISPESPVSLC